MTRIKSQSDGGRVVASGLIKFIFFDILFLPYAPSFVIPISLIPMVMVSVFLKIKFHGLKYQLYLLLSLSVTLACLGSILNPSTSDWARDNFLRMAQFLTSGLYFFIIASLVKEYSLKLPIKIVYIFVTYQLIILALFIVDAPAVISSLRMFYGSGMVSESAFEFNSRFAYMFQDPNTAAYFFLLAIAPIFTPLLDLSRRVKFRRFLFLLYAIFALSYIGITQSFGATISLFIASLYFVWHYSKSSRLFPLNVVVNLSLILFLLTAVVFIALDYNDRITTSGAILAKFDLSNQYVWDYILTGGKRFIIWSKTFEYFGAGNGYGYGFSLISDGVPWGPHSDWLHFFYAYGIVGLLCLTYFLFYRNSLSVFYLAPVLMAMTINSLINEQKLFVLYLIFLGFNYGLNYNQPGSNYFRSRAKARF